MSKPKNKITHSVLMVTYNQLETVDKAINSVINQGDSLLELIVSDDGSSDGTCERLKEYKEAYPELVTLIFSEKNCGIYENLNKLRRIANGDIVHFLGGDDYLLDGMFEVYNSKVTKAVDFCQTEIVFVPHVLIEYKEKKFIKKNRDYGTKIFSRLLRDEFDIRATGYSQAFYRKLPEWRLDAGICADKLAELELYFGSDPIEIPIDSAFPVYRAGIGASSSEKLIKIYSSYAKVYTVILNKYGVRMSKKDWSYALYKTKMYQFLAAPTFASVVNFSFHFVKNLANGAKLRDVYGPFASYLLRLVK